MNAYTCLGLYYVCLRLSPVAQCDCELWQLCAAPSCRLCSWSPSERHPEPAAWCPPLTGWTEWPLRVGSLRHIEGWGGFKGQRGWSINKCIYSFIFFLNLETIWLLKIQLLCESLRENHLHCLGPESLDQDLYRGLWPFSPWLQPERIPETSSDWPERGKDGKASWKLDLRIAQLVITELNLTTTKHYLCAEFSQSLFIQVGLFINSGFIPKLRTKRGSVLKVQII